MSLPVSLHCSAGNIYEIGSICFGESQPRQGGAIQPKYFLPLIGFLQNFERAPLWLLLLLLLLFSVLQAEFFVAFFFFLIC